MVCRFYIRNKLNIPLNTHSFLFLQKIRTYLRTYIAQICPHYYLCKNLFKLTWKKAGRFLVAGFYCTEQTVIIKLLVFFTANLPKLPEQGTLEADAAIAKVTLFRRSFTCIALIKRDCGHYRDISDPRP